MQEAESKQEVGQSYEISNPTPWDLLPASRLHLPKFLLLPQTAPPTGGLGIQTQEPLKDILYPNLNLRDSYGNGDKEGHVLTIKGLYRGEEANCKPVHPY